jgi:F0F1-type ATP synthase assembly protein I
MKSYRQRLRELRGGALVSIVGIQLVVSIVIGWWVGSWIDERFKTEPWFTLLGFLLGTAAGFVELFRVVAQASKDEDSSQK